MNTTKSRTVKCTHPVWQNPIQSSIVLSSMSRWHTIDTHGPDCQKTHQPFWSRSQATRRLINPFGAILTSLLDSFLTIHGNVLQVTQEACDCGSDSLWQQPPACWSVEMCYPSRSFWSDATSPAMQWQRQSSIAAIELLDADVEDIRAQAMYLFASNRYWKIRHKLHSIYCRSSKEKISIEVHEV